MLCGTLSSIIEKPHHHCAHRLLSSPAVAPSPLARAQKNSRPHHHQNLRRPYFQIAEQATLVPRQFAALRHQVLHPHRVVTGPNSLAWAKAQMPRTTAPTISVAKTGANFATLRIGSNNLAAYPLLLHGCLQSASMRLDIVSQLAPAFTLVSPLASPLCGRAALRVKICLRAFYSSGLLLNPAMN